MLRVVLCDDDPSMLNELCTLLAQYRAERGQELDYTAFHNPLDLMAEIERGVRYDILFLDILMPGETGIDAAAEIRRYDSNVKIIFLTPSPEYAVQSYTVNAYFYQLKPVWREGFFRLMDSVVASCEKEHTDSLVLQCKSGVTRMELRHLEYCEVLGHSLLFHLKDGRVLESTGGMKSLMDQLAGDSRFLRIHRSYLVNMEHIKTITIRNVTMSSMAQLPVPRGKYEPIKDAYLEYAFRRKQVFA